MMLYEGNCLQVMKNLPDNSVDSIVTDPPYGLSFMGKKWDYDVPSVEIWREAFRVLKHGGHLLSFAGSRTYHRMAVNIEDAGFEIRDQIMWVYGSGFPKNYDIGKAIDKAAGAERKVVGYDSSKVRPNKENYAKRTDRQPSSGAIEGWKDNGATITAPTTPEAKQWDGWGTALKPAHEPIVVARKPLIGTIVENVLEHGTGGLNIDDCRIEYDKESYERNQKASEKESKQHEKAVWKDSGHKERRDVFSPKGRFPANVIHDGSDEVVSRFPNTKGATSRTDTVSTGMFAGGDAGTVYPDSGSAARFFYCAKASKQERNAGCENIEPQKMGRNQSSLEGGEMLTGAGNERSNTKNNFHPTVKPVALMKYLCRLVTPPKGIILDPFMGSGTTGIAAKVEGFNFIGIEMDVEYLAIAESRINHWVEEYEVIHKTKHEWV